MSITRTFSTGIPKHKTEQIIGLLNGWSEYLCDAIFFSTKPFTVTVEILDLGIFNTVENLLDEAQTFISANLAMMMRVEKESLQVTEIFDDFRLKHKEIELSVNVKEDGFHIKMLNRLNLKTTTGYIPKSFVFENMDVKIKFIYNILENLLEEITDKKSEVMVIDAIISYMEPVKIQEHVYSTNLVSYEQAMRTKPLVHIDLMNPNPIYIKMYLNPNKEIVVKNLRYIVNTAHEQLEKIYGTKQLSFLHIPLNEAIQKLIDYHETKLGIYISDSAIND